MCCAGWITTREGTWIWSVAVCRVILRPFGRLFAGAPGTLMYKELQRGRLSYRMYCFIKD